MAYPTPERRPPVTVVMSFPLALQRRDFIW